MEKDMEKMKELSMETYYESGYSSSIAAQGSPRVFNQCLEDIYEKFKQKCRNDIEEQHRLNAPYKEKKEKLKVELKKKETLKVIKEEECSDYENKIDLLKSEITGVKNDPEKYGIDAKKKPRAQFFLGLMVLIPITVYLIVFYMSASYSAFFKSFNTTALVNAIFDANAFERALQDGYLEAIFVSTIPFVFMGLGYLLHMFSKDKRYGTVKIIGLVIVTFVFDAILAFQIEKKIYDIEKTLVSEPFNLQIAFDRVEFWGIIFAGFVVYIIWGFVFDLIMKEHENSDKIKTYIKKLKEDIANTNVKLEEVSITLKTLRAEISEIKGRIEELQAKIDGFIFPNRKYKVYNAAYVKGWYMAIQSEISLSHSNKEDLVKSCEKAASDHLKKYKVDSADAENVIYKHN